VPPPLPPPLWSCKKVSFIVARCRLVSFVKISFTHIFTNLELLVRHRFCEFIRICPDLCFYLISNTLQHISQSPQGLAGEFFSQTAWLMLWCLISVNQYFTMRRRQDAFLVLIMPEVLNCQHCWQKVTNSRLFCLTVAWGRLACVLLALPLLGETTPCIWCSGEYGESTTGTWEPGVKGMKGACKGENLKGRMQGKAADVSTRRSLLLHWSLPLFYKGEQAF